MFDAIEVTRPPHRGPPRPRARPGSRARGGRGGEAREPPPREPRGTPCRCFSASRARRRPLPRTPCTCIVASRARKSESPRTPCSSFAASRARRSESPRTPCTRVAPSRARRSESPRTPCTCVAACRARRSPSPGTPCRSTLPGPSRAGTSDLGGASYSPSAVACQDSRTWRRVAARGSVTTSSSGAPRFFTPSCYTF